MCGYKPFKMTSLQEINAQLPSIDILSKKHRGVGYILSSYPAHSNPGRKAQVGPQHGRRELLNCDGCGLLEPVQYGCRLYLEPVQYGCRLYLEPVQYGCRLYLEPVQYGCRLYLEPVQ
jgi:hypothetical protein